MPTETRQSWAGRDEIARRATRRCRWTVGLTVLAVSRALTGDDRSAVAEFLDRHFPPA